MSSNKIKKAVENLKATYNTNNPFVICEHLGITVRERNFNETRKQAIYEYKEKKTTGGVYKITNTESKKSLIKGEIDLSSMENRFNFSVKTNSCLNLKLREDWNKYGANSFTFEVLEEVEMKSEMDRRQFKKQLDELADKYSEKMNKDELY